MCLIGFCVLFLGVTSHQLDLLCAVCWLVKLVVSSGAVSEILVEPPALSKMAVMVSDIHVTARTCHGRQRKRASANVMTGVMLLLSEPRHQISTLHVPCGLLTKISYFCLPFTSLMNTLLLGSVFFPTIFMCAIVSVTIQLQPQRINTALSYSKCPNLPCPNKLLTHLQEFH